MIDRTHVTENLKTLSEKSSDRISQRVIFHFCLSTLPTWHAQILCTILGHCYCCHWQMIFVDVVHCENALDEGLTIFWTFLASLKKDQRFQCDAENVEKGNGNWVNSNSIWKLFFFFFRLHSVLSSCLAFVLLSARFPSVASRQCAKWC